MAVCSHCGRDSRSGDRFCQYCGQQLDLGKAQLVAASAPRYASATGEPPVDWQGPLADAPAVPSAGQQDGDDPSPSPDQPHQLPRLARLVVRPLLETPDGDHHVVPDAPGREYQLDDSDIAIGRAPSCDIVLEGDQLASRRHALLRRRGAVYTIVDLGSSNGTYVNDLEIREATALKDGDVITIGAHELTFSTAPASPHASIPGAALAASSSGASLGETDPSASAVNPAIFSPPASNGQWLPADHVIALDAAPAPAEAPPEDVVAPDSAVPADSLDIGDSEDVLVVPADDAHADAPDQAEASDESDAPPASDEAAVPVEAPAEAAPAFAVASAGEGSVAALSATSVATGATNLEELRAQLADIGTALARKADEEARAAGRLRTALAEARDRLAALSAQTAQQEQSPADDASVPAANVSELVSIARQAAENPRHLDYLTGLAARAGEIAAVLEALEARQTGAQSAASNAEVLDVLNELRARLDDALK